jgi:hypothetical protein
MNPLQSFIDAECIEDEDAEVPTLDLWERFKPDRDVETAKLIPSIKSFGQYLKQLGYEKKTSKKRERLDRYSSTRYSRIR